MKRLLATLTLIVCLSFPVQAGHVLGNGAWCDCDNPDHISTQSVGSNDDSGTLENTEQPTTPDIELALLLLAFMIYLRAKA